MAKPRLQPLVGRWWLPEGRRKIRYGSLEFSLDGSAATLTLNGTLTSDDVLATYQTILGVTSFGEKITLMRCLRTRVEGASTRAGRTGVETVHVETVFRGMHVRDEASPIWTQAALSVRHFDEWLSSSILTERIESGEDPDGWWHSLKVLHPENIECDTPIGRVVVAIGVSEDMEFGVRHEIRRGGGLRCDLQEPITFEDLLKLVVRPIEYLFTMVCDTATPVEELELAGPLKRRLGRESFPTFIGVQGRPIILSDSTSDAPQWSEMMFHVASARSVLPLLLPEWFRLYSQLKRMMDLLFGVLLGPRMFLESRFLLLCQAAELYHRENFSNEVLPKADHRRRIDSVVSSTEVQYQEWLKEKLAYSNEPTLRNRLEDLTKKASSAVRMLRPDIAAVAADTRNYLTHYSRKKRRVAEGEDLWRLSEELRLLMYGCLLLECGRDAEEVWGWIRNLRTTRGLLAR